MYNSRSIELLKQAAAGVMHYSKTIKIVTSHCAFPLWYGKHRRDIHVCCG